MLLLFSHLCELNFSDLMEIYIDGNRENAVDRYPNESEYQGLLLAEQDFYQYLKECFFLTPGAFYAVWMEKGNYVSALRLEPYRDGLLLEALETKPEERRKGYAGLLVNGVLAYLREQKSVVVYSHVNKRNVPSRRIHESCGFQKILDYAVYADGSVLSNSVTYRYNFEAEQSE
ncbi:MAG: GNAT family N-acetyltransferase [Oscillospiraceae bacterium]|nr:GNAT family N-acetyltransferase [Oscillospiraceae bacterium]